MGQLQIDNSFVKLRGISFPADLIRAAMLETGGIVVGDENINQLLDRAWNTYKTRTGKIPDSLIIEAIPTYRFVPKRIRLHTGKLGTPSFDLEGRELNANLYFAVRRVFHA